MHSAVHWSGLIEQTTFPRAWAHVRTNEVEIAVTVEDLNERNIAFHVAQTQGRVNDETNLANLKTVKRYYLM